MFLEVTPFNERYWKMAYRFAGKHKALALGHKALALGMYPAVFLKHARKTLELQQITRNDEDFSLLRK
jgi:hypothetical protein